MVMTPDEIARFKEWYGGFSGQLPTQSQVGEWITNDRAQQAQALEANRMRWAMQNGSATTTPAYDFGTVGQDWAGKGYAVPSGDMLTAPEVRRGVMDMLTRRVPQEALQGPVNPTLSSEEWDRLYWEKIEPHLGSTAGLMAGRKALAENVGDLLSTIRSLQPKGQGRALVSIPELRAKSGLSAQEFDKQLWQLAMDGEVFLHPHDFASSLKPAERAKLLAIDNPNAYWGGKDFYGGVVPK